MQEETEHRERRLLKNRIKTLYASHSGENPRQTQSHTQIWTMASTTSGDVLPTGPRIFISFPDLFFLPEWVSVTLVIPPPCFIFSLLSYITLYTADSEHSFFYLPFFEHCFFIYWCLLIQHHFDPVSFPLPLKHLSVEESLL